MNITVHYPDNQTEMEELIKLTEKVHSETAIAYLCSLTISASQKKKILDDIIGGRSDIDKKHLAQKKQ